MERGNLVIRYVPPIRDMEFVLRELLRMEDVLAALPAHQDVTWDVAAHVLAEAGRFCSETLAPLNQSGDEQGCHFEAGDVTTPRGFKDAYAQFRADGWQAIVADPEHGGQGLPYAIGRAVEEMLNSANQAWTMYVSLTHGAYSAVKTHAPPALQRLYLGRLSRGDWTGTMCLTEPQCGTDLGLIRCKAEGSAVTGYRLTGTKIFVSSGEHDLSDNIVHLVLARLPDAPPGTKGLSLFLVPKFIPADDGSIGERNAVRCTGIESKMGIHGNATCTLDFEGATALLLGEPHRGLSAMFTMMNGARLTVGLQSLGLAEAAYQAARSYATERLQSRSLSGAKAPELPADPIVVHADVRRMLLTQKAYLEAGRALVSFIALSTDEQKHHPDATVRQQREALIALLTPLAKAFLTDNGWLCTNLALQVFGGHGYIRDTGIEQIVRDARINPVYEGTNGIQALDLLGRKVLLDRGEKLRLLMDLIRGFIEQDQADPVVSHLTEPLARLVADVEHITQEIGIKAFANPDEVGAAAADYLRVLGHLVYGYLWARMARIAAPRAAADPFYAAKLATARFYFERVLPETQTLLQNIRSGASNLFELPPEAF
jgi:alkylation response protein AidB-like acyl-CoA dehydrogenase